MNEKGVVCREPLEGTSNRIARNSRCLGRFRNEGILPEVAAMQVPLPCCCIPLLHPKRFLMPGEISRSFIRRWESAFATDRKHPFIRRIMKIADALVSNRFKPCGCWQGFQAASRRRERKKHRGAKCYQSLQFRFQFGVSSCS